MSCLPDIPPVDSHYLLVVVLTTLQQHSRESLESILQHEKNSSNKVPAFVYCVDNRFQRQLEQFGRDGSIGQIYNTATDASSIGWKRLIIVDDLTREQLTGNVRPGRPKEVSVVYVQIDGTRGHGPYGKPSEEIHVMAKRMHILDAQKALTEQKSLSFNIPRNNEEETETPQDYYDAGILLYDPSKSVYDKSLPSFNAPNPTADAIDQVFSLHPPLPPEVTLKIREFAQEECDLKHMTAAPAKYPTTPKKLHVHSLIRMSVEETKHYEDLCNEKIRECGTDATCTIHPWTASRPANRRDIWRLYQRFFDANRYMQHPVFLFVGWLGWQKDTEIGVLQCYCEYPQSTRRLTIEKALKVWRGSYGPPYYGSDHCGPYDDPAFELILDPYARFFYDPPPFVSFISDIMAVPVFFLTRHITEDDTNVIKTNMRKPRESNEGLNYPEINFVNWHSNRDGSEEDVWRLLWQCSSYRGNGRTNTAVFVDKQTVSDNKVIVADVMCGAGVGEIRRLVLDAKYGPYNGMQYGRQPLEQAAIIWRKIDGSDMAFEDFFGPGSPYGWNEEIHTWSRPDTIWQYFDF